MVVCVATGAAIVGGVAVVGILAYLIYKHFYPSEESAEAKNRELREKIDTMLKTLNSGALKLSAAQIAGINDQWQQVPSSQFIVPVS